MNLTILSWIINIGIWIIIFILFILYKIYKKKYSNDTVLGIIILKDKYTIENNYFEANVGNIINKDDVIINGINDHLFVSESKDQRSLLRMQPKINGYIEINGNNVIVIYKKPVLFIIIIAFMIIFLGSISKQNMLYILILLIIFGRIALFFNIIKFNSIKLDIDYFIHYGK